MSDTYAPLGGKLWTKPFSILFMLAVVGLVLIGYRFLFGLGAVTNLNDGYPWGLWIVYDILVATGLACGGYAMAILVYAFNRGQYHPLIRPALLASVFGYTLAAGAIVIDTGRYWNLINIFLPQTSNIGSSWMVEVAISISAYIVVLWLELSPVMLEKWNKTKLRRRVHRIMFVVVAFGMLFPTLHQSSLGGLMIVAGDKLSPLWQTNWLPALFLLSALSMGFAVVVFEAIFSATVLKRPYEQSMLSKLAGTIPWILGFYLILRWTTLLINGGLSDWALNAKGIMFIIENLLFIYPFIVLLSEANRGKLTQLFYASISILLAGAVYRFDAFLVGFEPGGGYVYFPAVAEILITVGIISIELVAYLFFVKRFPVLPVLKDA
ncbi:MAG: Ni/Fe-hydrogenase cytochrome b subunit [Candidatus Marinimicrobia bacterium]|nr:Ni/Fe-hydrogenase cytochrome b subunit [Candidatus Neomarinimicrobiota bacterium]MCF7921079.1 Ni/Fe-hydrogenase cytochrome b subunit [Candidatus Neomarinimicrobiota bacterium]